MSAEAVFRFWAEPGAALAENWPAGNVTVEVPAYVIPSGPSTTYKLWVRLYRGQHQSDAESNPWDTGTLYAPPPGLEQTLGTALAKYTFSVPVRDLSGQASDRLLLEVKGGRADVNTGGDVHIVCDGADNQVRILSPFVSVPEKPPLLQRNPDETRPTNVASMSFSGGPFTFGTWPCEAGYPALVIWPTKVWRFRIWAKLDHGDPVTLYGHVGRKTTAGVVTDLATLTVGTVNSSNWTLLRADVLVPQSSGDILDVPEVSLSASTTGTAEILVGIGVDNPSSINAPLLSPPGGTTSAPTDDHKVQVQADGLIGYLSEVMASPDASVLVTVSSVTGKVSLQVTGIGRGSDTVGTATVTDGIVSIPSPLRKARLNINENTEILGIDPTGWPDGGEAVLYIYVAPYVKLTIRHQAADLADNARLRLAQASDSEYSTHVRLRCELDSATNGDHTWWVEDLVT